MKRAVLTTHRGKSYLPEIALCLGPQTMGQPGSGTYADLYGRMWASTIEPDGLIHLWQATASDWQEVPIPQPPHDPRTMRHHSLAFDQSARHVLAYEIAGQIYIRQWDATTNQYVMRGPWPGADPCLLWDFGIDVSLFPASAQPQGNSDVILFHLTADRLSVGYRLQRELYNIFHLLATFSTPQYLDQAFDTGTRRYQLALGDDAGGRQYLLSDSYPWSYTDPVRMTAAPVSVGRFANTYATATTDAVRFAAQPTALGRYSSTYQYTATDSVRFTAQPLSITRTLVSDTYQYNATDSVRFTAQPTGATRSLTTVQTNPTDSVRFAAQPVAINRKTMV